MFRHSLALKSGDEQVLNTYFLFLFQIGGNTPNEGAVYNLQVEDAGDKVKKIPRKESANLSSSSIKANGLQTETHNCKHARKLKKKLLKYRAVSMRLNSQFLFRASLSLWKKRKHKRNKRGTLDVRNLGRANLLDTDSTSIDLGPSTSESSRTITFLARPLRKGTKSGSERGANNAAPLDLMTSSGNCFMEDVIDGKFREQIYQCGTVLATDKQLGKSSSLDQLEIRRSDGPNDGKRKVVLNGLMSMLTRGLEETVGNLDFSFVVF